MLITSQFEDIRASADSNQDGSKPVPVPYHRFSFSPGFNIVSLPHGKYRASSGSQMLQIDASTTGKIDLGQLRDNACFRFDFEGVSLGCDSANSPCSFRVSGLQWNGVEDVVQRSEVFDIDACPDPSNCKLKHLTILIPIYTNLTSVNISLLKESESKTWWIDDLQLAWTDDDCSVAACRSRVPNTASGASGTIVGRAKTLLRWAVRG